MVKNGKRDRRAQYQQTQELEAEVQARLQGPEKISWTRKDLADIRPRTPNQMSACRAWAEGDHLALLGSAGVGKTFLACYFASCAMLDEKSEQDRIVIIRSAVQGRDVGALPGKLSEKLAEYEVPYADAFGELFGPPSTYRLMKGKGKIVFASTSFLRGTNLRNAIVIVEEAQNMNFGEIDSAITRLNETSRFIITGDSYRQCDLGHREISGLPIFEQVAPDVRGVTVVQFTRHDCQRKGLVESWLAATEDHFQRMRQHR